MKNQAQTIVVTGSHSVGKTTLCNALRTALLTQHNRIGFIPEIARILLSRGIPMNDSVSEFAIVNYLLEYFVQARQQHADVVISDRSIFDLLAYITTSRPIDVRDEFVRLVEEIVIGEVSRVSLYVYVPIEFALEVDEVRPADLQYQKSVDGQILTLLHKFDAPVLIVSGSVELRVNQVLEALKSQ